MNALQESKNTSNVPRRFMAFCADPPMDSSEKGIQNGYYDNKGFKSMTNDQNGDYNPPGKPTKKKKRDEDGPTPRERSGENDEEKRSRPDEREERRDDDRRRSRRDRSRSSERRRHRRSRSRGRSRSRSRSSERRRSRNRSYERRRRSNSRERRRSSRDRRLARLKEEAAASPPQIDCTQNKTARHRPNKRKRQKNEAGGDGSPPPADDNNNNGDFDRQWQSWPPQHGTNNNASNSQPTNRGVDVASIVQNLDQVWPAWTTTALALGLVDLQMQAPPPQIQSPPDSQLLLSSPANRNFDLREIIERRRRARLASPSPAVFTNCDALLGGSLDSAEPSSSLAGEMAPKSRSPTTSLSRASTPPLPAISPTRESQMEVPPDFPPSTNAVKLWEEESTRKALDKWRDELLSVKPRVEPPRPVEESRDTPPWPAAQKYNDDQHAIPLIEPELFEELKLEDPRHAPVESDECRSLTPLELPLPRFSQHLHKGWEDGPFEWGAIEPTIFPEDLLKQQLQLQQEANACHFKRNKQTGEHERVSRSQTLNSDQVQQALSSDIIRLALDSPTVRQALDSPTIKKTIKNASKKKKSSPLPPSPPPPPPPPRLSVNTDVIQNALKSPEIQRSLSSPTLHQALNSDIMQSSPDTDLTPNEQAYYRPQQKQQFANNATTSMDAFSQFDIVQQALNSPAIQATLDNPMLKQALDLHNLQQALNLNVIQTALTSPTVQALNSPSVQLALKSQANAMNLNATQSQILQTSNFHETLSSTHTATMQISATIQTNATIQNKTTQQITLETQELHTFRQSTSTDSQMMPPPPPKTSNEFYSPPCSPQNNYYSPQDMFLSSPLYEEQMSPTPMDICTPPQETKIRVITPKRTARKSFPNASGGKAPLSNEELRILADLKRKNRDLRVQLRQYLTFNQHAHVLIPNDLRLNDSDEEET